MTIRRREEGGVAGPTNWPGVQGERSKLAHSGPSFKKSWGEFAHSVRGRFPGAREALPSRTFAYDTHVTRRKNFVKGFETGHVSAEHHLAKSSRFLGHFLRIFRECCRRARKSKPHSLVLLSA